MAKRIVIPVEDRNGLESHIAQHFGRAPYFAVVDLDEKCAVSNVETQANTGEHLSGFGHSHENILTLKPNVIVAFGMGPGGLQNFKNAKIKVLKAEQSTVEEVIAAFRTGALKELTGGCEHAHHQYHHGH
jgi:predicted Fe-Mo cluster-binding NifX family protein